MPILVFTKKLEISKKPPDSTATDPNSLINANLCPMLKIPQIATRELKNN